jgi:hypothetical protein
VKSEHIKREPVDARDSLTCENACLSQRGQRRISFPSKTWTTVSVMGGTHVENHVQNEGCGEARQETGRSEVRLRQVRQKGAQGKIRMQTRKIAGLMDEPGEPGTAATFDRPAGRIFSRKSLGQ